MRVVKRLDAPSAWHIIFVIGDGPSARKVDIDLGSLITDAEYDISMDRPVSIVETGPLLGDLYIYKNCLFVTEGPALDATDFEEVTLRIKKIIFSEESELVSLRSYVTNMEAAVTYSTDDRRRTPISDDVKLAVWARDKGKCTRCGSNTTLHFDHIIPVAKGGGDDFDNIQILCQNCNLRKSDKIAF